jgi:transposase-like protein
LKQQSDYVNEQQRRAAELIGQGYGTGAVAREVGVSAKTVQRWRKLDGFQKSVAVNVDPTIRTTLEAALLANKRDGSPDHGVRIAAAKALMQLGEQPNPDAVEPTTIVIYKERS